MNYTPTQLEAIRIFGKKDLTFGCIFIDNYHTFFGKIDPTECVSISKGDIECDGIDYTHYRGNPSLHSSYEEVISERFEILGHEPHLEDVFRVAKEKKFHYIDLTHLSDGTHELCFAWTEETDDECIPYNPTLQLIEQSESTLQKLISLFE